MAKKRKAYRTFTEPQPSKSVKYDVDEKFDDSEDEFYAAKDKVLLGGDQNSTRRQQEAEQNRDLQLSDEEVLGFSENENEDENEDLDQSGQEDEDGSDSDETETENWGSNRADYYNADIIETEADALEEEAEAKRLQQKQLKGMSEADFGFDESAWVETEAISRGRKPIVEKLPELEISETATEAEKMSILRSRYPEFEPLARDFMTLLGKQKELEQTVRSNAKRLESGDVMGTGLPPQVKLQALSSYIGTIALYFAVLSSNLQPTSKSRNITSLPPAELREHSVIEKLARTRRNWDDLKDEPTAIVVTVKTQTSSPVEQKNLNLGISRNEVVAIENRTNQKKTKPKAAAQSAEVVQIEKKARKPKTKPSKHADLQALLSQSALPAEEDSDFGDENPLTEEQAAEKAEKAKKRKSLRFYTSQIAQKSNKRGAASRDAGGDDDLPYKERTRDRQERLLREAEARGQAHTNEQEELGNDIDADLQEAGSPDHYYNSVVANSNQRKAEKKARADAYAEAAKQGAQVYEEETVGADGKRAITYAIQKNKGLTPKRKKEVRNPRVKKRKKYDEKVKKLGSIRQVYKGGEGRGGYGGELTGIKTNIVRGIKL